MRILVACEESQEVCKAFRALGHEAYSCDLQECSGGHPEWHTRQDAYALLYPVVKGYNAFMTCDNELHEGGKWDLLIAHPPCTYLSNAGARWLYADGTLNKERYQQGLEGKEFFMKLLNADCPRICIENPIPSSVYELPPCTQIIQPYEYGEPSPASQERWQTNGAAILERRQTNETMLRQM